MQMRITINGTEKVIKKLKKLSELNFEPEFNKIGEYLKQYYSGEVFLSQGGVFGKRWQPIADGTRKYKTKHYTGKGILERTGNMRKSFTFTATKDSVMVTNTATYFKYHQSSEPRTKLPRRVMIGYNSAIKNQVRSLLNDGVKRLVNE
jgi:phage gpG-like protein